MVSTQQPDNASTLSLLARFDAEAFGADLGPMAGIDEAGRGPLAGPVVAAAVVFPKGADIPGVNDSKKLTAARREALFPEIHVAALSVGVGIVDAEEIDEINILAATKRAVRRALDALSVQPKALLLDALRLEDDARPQRSIIKGDAQSHSIAAASIVAKVVRDRLMVRYDAEFPEYGFAKHKGYGTKPHMEVLGEIGPSTLHRLSFAGVCFFQETCRKSRTFQAMAATLRGAGEKMSAADFGERMKALDSFLPAREIRELEQMALTRRARRRRS